MIAKWVLAMAMAVPLAAAQAQGPAPGRGEAVGRRLTATLHGFSICPPREVERVREASTHRLARWVRRDDKTGAVRWSMEVLKNQHKPNEMPAAEYAKVVAKELARNEQFKIESIDVTIVAQRPAMHFRGIWSGALQMWRRQIWVPLGPEEHLVLDVAGRMSDRGEMDAALTASAGTLRVFDPSAAIAERSKGLTRGSGVLGKLTHEKLRAVLADEPQYFLVELKGRTVGFLKISEGMATRSGARGLRVVRSGALKLAGKPRQLIREELFATADRAFETWRSTAVIGEGKAAAGPVVLEAIKQHGLLLVHTTRPGVARQTQQLQVPQPVRAAYLPAAFSAVLPRVLDRSRPGAYGFAVFSAEAGDFHLRTVRVVGPEQIVLDGKKVSGTRLTDRASQDAAVASLWADPKGFLLQMRTAEGLTTRRADRQDVLSAFAKELLELSKLERK